MEPTPVTMPSHTKLTAQSDAPAPVSAPRSQSENTPIRPSSLSVRKEPNGPKVIKNTSAIIPANSGSARYLLVAIASILSDRVSSPGSLSRVTHSAHTLQMNLYF